MLKRSKFIKASFLIISCLSFIIFVIYGLSKITKCYDISIVGSVKYADSISRQTIDAAKLLDKYFKVNGIPIWDKDLEYLDKNTASIFNRGNQLGRVILFEDNLTKSISGKDDKLQELENKQIFKLFDREEQIFIAYSMFESTSIPRIWVERINQQFDMVVVPDPFLIEVYKNAGITKPIFFVPLGVDLDRQLALPLKSKRNNKFLFANLSAGRDNKNQLKLIQAFAQVQKIHDNVFLLINSRFTKPGIREKITEFILNNHIKNVEYTVDSLPPELYTNIMQKIDCFVYPSKGEGFSIQPREAMALGTPTIVTNNTAQKTICNSGLVECVNSNIEQASYYDVWNNAFIGNNFDCTVEDLADAMLKVYENYDNYLKNSEAARKWATQYTYENLKARYINMVKPKKLILGDKNEITDDYLMTNSKELYDKYNSIILS